MLKLEFDGGLNQTINFLKNFTSDVYVKAVRSAMTKTMNIMGTSASRLVRENYRLKAGEVSPRRGKYLKVRKARGDNVALLNAELKASPDPVSLIKFTNQKPVEQKGVKIKKRKRLRAIRIGPNLTTRLPRAFIARARGRQGTGEAMQIFVRRKGTGKIVKKGVASVYKLLTREKFFKKLDSESQKIFVDQFNHEYKYYSSKIIK